MTLDYLLNTPVSGPDDDQRGYASYRPWVCPPLHCRDGTHLSVQASESHYCLPRTNEGPWSHVEVAAIGEDPVGWETYRTSDRIYGYVPVGLVREYLAQHGGQPGTLLENFAPAGAARLTEQAHIRLLTRADATVLAAMLLKGGHPQASMKLLDLVTTLTARAEQAEAALAVEQAKTALLWPVATKQTPPAP